MIESQPDPWSLTFSERISLGFLRIVRPFILPLVFDSMVASVSWDSLLCFLFSFSSFFLCIFYYVRVLGWCVFFCLFLVSLLLLFHFTFITRFLFTCLSVSFSSWFPYSFIITSLPLSANFLSFSFSLFRCFFYLLFSFQVYFYLSIAIL